MDDGDICASQLGFIRKATYCAVDVGVNRTALPYVAHSVLYGVNLPFLFEILLT
jgi:hypothetical protein